MSWRRRILGFLKYGVVPAHGKALLLCLAVSSQARADEVTVLAFGDSLTQGYGLVQERGFVPQLQAWLTGHGISVEIINGGVSGETTAGGAARVGWSLTPDIEAMIVALGANDMLRGIDPAVTRANLSAILDTAAAQDVPVLLVGVPASGNFGEDYKTAFDAIFPDLAARYGTLFYPNFFAGLGGDSLEDMREWMQPDGIHPNAEGVARIIEAIGPEVVKLIETSRERSPK